MTSHRSTEKAANRYTNDLVRTTRLKGTKRRDRVRSANRRDKKVTASEYSRVRK